jgi:hypothetical protein
LSIKQIEVLGSVQKWLLSLHLLTIPFLAGTGGLPEEAYWETLFDVELILSRLGIDGAVGENPCEKEKTIDIPRAIGL